MFDIRTQGLVEITEIKFADGHEDEQAYIIAKSDEFENHIMLVGNDHNELALVDMEDVDNLILALNKAKELFQWIDEG
jgi:hypothetical protein